ncbi:MAG: hypothetical protein AAF914_13305 [Pseudomonadota bacterium]
MSFARILAVALLWSQSPAVFAQAPAPVAVNLAEILDLAEAPWLTRVELRGRLETALGSILATDRALPSGLYEADPFLWVLEGHFGAPLDGAARPGGIVICARYGLASRDLMAETGLTDRTVFALYGATLADPDDASVWPPEAIARLSCTLTWDDTRRVEILAEAVAQPEFAARFRTVTRADDATGAAAIPFYGPDGFLLRGLGGPQTSVGVVESAEVELRPSHQRVSFRAFLLAGGM